MTELSPLPSESESHPADAHAVLARRAGAVLAKRFPAAGVGVTGSVAAGRHHAGSDVDLLLVEPSFPRDLQFAFVVDGVRANVVAASPERLVARLEGDAHRFASMLLGYVLGARTLHDPGGSLAGVRERAAAILARRQREPGTILAAVLARIGVLVDGGGAERAVAALLLDAWYLRRGRLLLEKRDAVRPFLIVAEEDADFSRLLSRLVAGEGDAALVEEMLARLQGGV